MGRARRGGFVQSRMGLVCCIKKALNCPSIKQDTSLFARGVDDFWGAGCGLGNPPAFSPPCPNLRQGFLPRATGSPAGSALPYGCHGVLGVTPKPFSMQEHRRQQAWTVPCQRAALPPRTGERPVLPHWRRQRPQRRQVELCWLS